MTSTDLKKQYRKETGKSHMEISVDTGSNFYSDEYTEWLEQRTDKNV